VEDVRNVALSPGGNNLEGGKGSLLPPTHDSEIYCPDGEEQTSPPLQISPLAFPIRISPPSKSSKSWGEGGLTFDYSTLLGEEGPTSSLLQIHPKSEDETLWGEGGTNLSPPKTQASEIYLHPQRGESSIKNPPPKQDSKIGPETIETGVWSACQAEVEALEDVPQQKKGQKATKADDAAVPEHIWEKHLLNDGPTPWVIKDVNKLRKAMNLLRQRMLRWWKRKVTTLFFDWSHQRYPELVSLGAKYGNEVRFGGTKYQWAQNDPYQTALGGRATYREWWTSRSLHAGEDIHPAADAIERTSNSSWWNWDDGSRPLHWRWPDWYMRIIRDGLPVIFDRINPRIGNCNEMKRTGPQRHVCRRSSQL
jgi:hypothetical protein